MPRPRAIYLHCPMGALTGSCLGPLKPGSMCVITVSMGGGLRSVEHQSLQTHKQILSIVTKSHFLFRLADRSATGPAALIVFRGSIFPSVVGK